MHDLKKNKKILYFKGIKKQILYVTCFAKTYNWHFKSKLFI